jgi:hypothetical protein
MGDKADRQAVASGIGRDRPDVLKGLNQHGVLSSQLASTADEHHYRFIFSIERKIFLFRSSLEKLSP